MASEVPWKKQTQQVIGRKDERDAARRSGARLHPNSGAGSEKNDYSTDDEIIEYKSVAKTHTVKGEDVGLLRVNASRQGKTGKYIIYFQDADVTLVGEIFHGKNTG